jgi:hypothetical protein
MNRSLLTGLALFAFMCSACHHIKADYPAYLEKHPASPGLPHLPLQVGYHIGDATLKHSITIRSATAGYGNKWIVELGAMLDQTMQSTEVRAAFANLRKGAASASGYDLGLDLVDYQVSGFSAHLTLRVVLRREGVVLIDRTYRSDGATQAGKVGWGGAFAMRDALHATTKHAVDAVLREFLIDVERATQNAAPSANWGGAA